ncbi:MAG: hypothetical protein WC735_04770 [Candidatus Paceibacterota bacterium]|jgi:hypothetical protein
MNSDTFVLFILWGISVPICIRTAKKMGSNTIVAALAGFCAPILSVVGYLYVASNHKKKKGVKEWIVG